MYDLDDPQVLTLLTEVAAEFEIDPTYPESNLKFTQNLLNQYSGSIEHLQTWYRQELRDNYRSIRGKPEWIQGPEWPASDRPLIFVGQVEVPPGILSTYAAACYVFCDPDKGLATTVIQHE